MKNLWIAVTAASLIAGCSTITPAVHEYTILPVYSSQNAPRTAVPLSLRITPSKSIASLASREFYYLREPSQTGSYLYSRWSDTPASMIERSLVSFLQNRRLFAALIPASSSATADLTLESDLHAFYHRFNADNGSEGFIDITYRLIDSKSKRVLSTQRFTVTSPSKSADAAGGVAALNTATQTLNQQTALWLETTSKEKQWIK